MRQKVNAAASLGVDVIQIDDGWQKGRTSNSAQAGKGLGWLSGRQPEFWAPHAERFPTARSRIIAANYPGTGDTVRLWYAP